jgi:hypothetical protein
MSKVNISIGSMILMCLIGLTSCMNKAEMQSENSENVVPLSSPPSNSKVEQLANVENQATPSLASNPFVIPKEQANAGLKKAVKEIYDKIHKFSRVAGLTNLKKDKFSAHEKEIRVWEIDANMSVQGFLSSYRKGKWIAISINRVDTENTLVKKYLNEPRSGWNNWLKYLEDSETIFNKSSNNIPTFDFDAGIFVVELKTDRNYIINMYSPSEINKDSKSSVGVCSKIREEFNVNFYCGKS